jgi:hypothetical protein
MTWRRGELWLDADVLWFREGPGAPAVAGIPSLPVFAPTPPPGLAASRVRRAAWKRRREVRRARTTAVALSPALVLMLAALRSAGNSGSDVLAEDLPSVSFKVDAGTGVNGLRALGAGRESAESGVVIDLPPAREPEAVHRRVSLAAAAPKIEWHHATSVGLPYDGRLVDGTQLPVEGPDWVTWDPVTDGVPNQPDRLYGNERTIRAIVSVTKAYRLANPGAPRVVIGDISRKGGGPMTDEHVSHQNGLDVDVYFPRLGGTLRAPVAQDEIDHRLAQDLLNRFVAAGAQMIFVGFHTGLHGPAGVVIPYAGHEYHMHVRFPPPAG